MDMYALLQPIRAFAAHRPVWGTCAGMIVMAKQATDLDRETLGLMDISVVRNAFGRQLDSFETDLEIEELGEPPLHAVFIRAPLIKEAGPGVKVMAQIEGTGIVAARQGHLLATAFHPELTPDTRMHSYFLTLGGEVSPVK
jgi:5'-phosphate synthase pdxT subunit